MLYINNRKNTNHKERDYIYNSFYNTDWCKLDEPVLTNEEYKENLDTLAKIKNKRADFL